MAALGAGLPGVRPTGLLGTCARSVDIREPVDDLFDADASVSFAALLAARVNAAFCAGVAACAGCTAAVGAGIATGVVVPAFLLVRAII